VGRGLRWRPRTIRDKAVTLRHGALRKIPEAEVSREAVVVKLVGVADPRQEERYLRAHLDTWLRLYGAGVGAEIKS
jgi:hypothetical protein